MTIRVTLRVPFTLPQMLEWKAVKNGNRTFLFSGDEQIPYATMAYRAQRVATLLASNGVEAGDRVGILMANSPEFLYALFGAWRAGAVAVPINPALTAEEVGYILSDAWTRALIVDQQRAELVPRLPEAGRVFKMQEQVALWSMAAEVEGSPPPMPQNEHSIASLIYTSGTTGHPKGVMLTHRNYLFDAEAALEAIGMSQDDRFLCILPLFHVNAQVVTTLCPLLASAQTVLLPRFAPDTFLQDVARYRATAFSAVPTVYAILLARGEMAADLDLSSLRYGICGAAPMPVEVFEKFEARFGIKILEGYGLSEATCVSSVNPVDGVRKIGSIGVPIPGQDMRIVNDGGKPVPDGMVGEIVVRGDNVMVGYYGNADATAQAIRDGWLHTGDLGVRDADGYFTIVGRKKEMIIRGGENIYPKEVEEVLHRHPQVQEAAVLGLPDAVWGEIVGAAIVLRPGAAPDAAAIQDWCRQHLAAFKCPAQVFFLEAAAVPRTATGKIQKNRLRDLVSIPVVENPR